jgi:hypothetical protein
VEQDGDFYSYVNCAVGFTTTDLAEDFAKIAAGTPARGKKSSK